MTAPTLASAPVTPSATGRLQVGWMLGVLSLLMGFASLSTDVYLPAMPAMARMLGAGTGSMEFTVSGYLIGFSLGQLFWGPLGDRLGRRGPIAAGLLLFVLGSAGCALSETVESLIGFRILQALGASAGVVLSRAMVRDLYSGDRAAQMLSTLITVMGLAPLLGPILGGQILGFASWHAIFWVLVVVGLFTFIAILSLPETLVAERRSREPIERVVRRYGTLMADRRTMGLCGAGAFFYAGMFAYVAGSPAVYVDYYGVAPQNYGWLFGAGVIGIMALNLVNARLVTKVGTLRMLRYGTAGAILASAALVVTSAAGIGGLWATVAGLVAFASMTGLIVANSIAGAMNLNPDRAGAVSALAGAIQYGSGIFGSALTGIFSNGTPVPMAVVILLCSISAALCAFCLSTPVANDKAPATAG
jgi:DHA1 family bicyclomycin/chloramphenicol resistance-like MFS transporter